MLKYLDLSGYFFYYRRGGELMIVSPEGRRQRSSLSEGALVARGMRYGTGLVPISALLS
jgi:hypothetical protein